MTVTKPYLTGADEPFAETIRHLLASKWDSANTSGIKPAFLSPNGVNDEIADSTKNNYGLDWTALINKTDLVRIDNGETEPLVESRYVSEFMTTVYIDLFSRNTYAIEQFKTEVNRILFENQPNTSIRLNKSGGMPSRDMSKEFTMGESGAVGLANDPDTGFLALNTNHNVYLYDHDGTSAGFLHVEEHESAGAFAFDPDGTVRPEWIFFVGEEDRISIFDASRQLRASLDTELNLNEHVIGMALHDGKLYYLTESGKINIIEGTLASYTHREYMTLSGFSAATGALTIGEGRIYIARAGSTEIMVIDLASKTRLTDADFDVGVEATGLTVHDDRLYIVDGTTAVRTYLLLQQSPITGFRQNAIGWINPRGMDEAGAAVMAAGELGCKWQLHLT